MGNQPSTMLVTNTQMKYCRNCSFTLIIFLVIHYEQAKLIQVCIPHISSLDITVSDCSAIVLSMSCALMDDQHQPPIVKLWSSA
jgi:hypothetical protein